MKKVFEKQSIGLRMSIKNKIFVLGDSFSHMGAPSPNGMGSPNIFWAKILHESFKDTHELIVDSFPSRDVQTIIDNWIKILPSLTKDDILIIGIPYFIRFRVPLHKKDYMLVKWDSGFLVNRFVTHHSWYTTDSQVIYLDEQTSIPKNELDDKTEFFEKMFFNNESVEKNYNEVIESLYKLTPSNKYLFSWDNMKYQTDVIEYQHQIENKIGWTTLHDLYVEIKDDPGRINDYHWDYRFEIKFGKYLIDKFKK